jgi:GrpB-like predicted nucleotidyltransferase (UPF0157 family)
MGDAPIIEPYHHMPAVCREHDPRAMDVARQVGSLIESQLLGVVVEHVGRTSVPGCAGKGVVDLMVLYPSGRLFPWLAPVTIATVQASCSSIGVAAFSNDDMAHESGQRSGGRV